MADKPVKVNAFEEAARDLGIATETFMLWVMRTKRPTPTRWSQWEGGHKPIPDEWVREYLRDARQVGREDSEIVADVLRHIETEMSGRLRDLRPELKPLFADHLKRQVSLFLDGAQERSDSAGSPGDVDARRRRGAG